MPPTLKPPRLGYGDTVGIVSPSWGGAGMFRHRVERGIAHLRSLGFEVSVGAHALNQLGHVSDTPENRVADIHAMFLDPDVRLILSAIGGDHSCQLLPLLDFELIRRHPTIFMGFSDTTVLNVAIWQQTGLVTFNGPALLTDFAEFPSMPSYTEQSFLRTVTNADPLGLVAPSDSWTDEFLDWAEQKDLERPRTLQPSEGWYWLRDGTATGTLVGGCIGSLEHLRGTPYWPDFMGAILFLETSEERPLPSRVDALLMDYRNMGVFDQIRGLLVGRPWGYTAEERADLREIVASHAAGFDFPVVTDMDFGHTAPQFVLPIGCRARIDSRTRAFEIIEPAVT